MHMTYPTRQFPTHSVPHEACAWEADGDWSIAPPARSQMALVVTEGNGDRPEEAEEDEEEEEEEEAAVRRSLLTAPAVQLLGGCGRSANEGEDSPWVDERPVELPRWAQSARGRRWRAGVGLRAQSRRAWGPRHLSATFV